MGLILMIVIANGFTTIAEKNIPSGLTSILSALSPVIIFIGSILFISYSCCWSWQIKILL
jgi:drug/metabolite transporter (DMT)-like permease